MTIYLQSPDKTQISVFQNENQIGAGFISWTKLTDTEIAVYLLKQAKDKKQSDLQNFYKSQECWTYKIFTNNANPAVLKGTYASLTRDADFFARTIPAALGYIIVVFDDNNNPIEYALSETKGRTLNNLINVINGRKLKGEQLSLELQINNAKTIAEVDKIDFKTALLNIVERNINLDNL